MFKVGSVFFGKREYFLRSGSKKAKKQQKKDGNFNFALCMYLMYIMHYACTE